MPTKKVKNRILFTQEGNSSYFCTMRNKILLLFEVSPTDVIKNDSLMIGKKMRLGGMVKKNSILVNKKEIKFIITDFKNEIIVSFKGSVPNLFSEEKGVIAEGELKDKKFFIVE